MILYLNLLPDKEKKRIRLSYIYSCIKKESIFLLTILLLLNIGVFYIKWNLEQNLFDIEARLKANKDKEELLISQIGSFNKEIDSFKKVQANFRIRSSLLLELFELMPEGITLSAINIDQDNQLILGGRYQSRDQLLQFKESLSRGFMVDIDFPIAYLLKEEGGQFNIKGQVVKPGV